jgi:hypothetical protein
MTSASNDKLPLVPGGTLITATPEEGRRLAREMTRKMAYSLSPRSDDSRMGRFEAMHLITACQAIELAFQTIAAANNYWRDSQCAERLTDAEGNWEVAECSIA